MKSGSVIIDLAAAGGGNCTLTQKGEKIFWNDQVHINGELDFPSKMARQSSEMYANNMYNLLDHISNYGGADKKNANDTAKDVIPHLTETGDLAKDESPEVVTNQVIACYKGAIRDAGPPPMPAAPAAKKPEPVKAEIKKVGAVSDSIFASHQFAMSFFTVIMTLVAFLNNEILIELMLVFVLAAWVGYMLVYGVHPALHTPLMSVSNAISGVVILGGIFMVSSEEVATSFFGGVAIFIASMNVFGGFVVTYRMLLMFVTEK
jgi:NAD/NADP transhydrogenase alpha subunit